MGSRFSRRRFVTAAPLTALGAALLAACSSQPAAPTAVPAATTAASGAPTVAPTAAPAATVAPTAAATTAPPVAPTAAASPATAASPSAAVASAGAPSGVFRYGTVQTGVIPTWLPWKQLSSAQLYPWLFTMSKLVTVDTDQTVRPDLAQKWDVSADGKTYTFSLRTGVKFHDGTPLTAKDVAFTFGAALQPKAGSTFATQINVVGAQDFVSGKTQTPEGIQVVDDHTIKFVLDAPNIQIMPVVFGTLWIVPAHVFDGVKVEDYEKQKVSTDKPIGTGPFVMTEYISDQHILMQANKDYFLGPPKLDQVIIKFYGDNSVMLIDLQKGQIDSAQPLATPDDWKKVQADPNLVVDEVVSGFSTFISASYTRAWLKDKRIRQGMLTAIDRKTIADKVFGGIRVQSPATPWTAAWALPSDLNTYDYNPDKAKQLLQAANWDSSRELTMIWFGTTPSDDLPIIQQQLQAVGVKIKPVQTERSRIMNIFYETGDYDLCYLGGYGSADGNPWGTDSTFYCDAIYPKGWNSMHYCNQQFDTLLHDALKQTDQKKATSELQQVASIFNTDLPYLPLYLGKGGFVYNKRVQGWDKMTKGRYNGTGQWDVWNWTVS